MTNFEKIKNMNIDEMADFLNDVTITVGDLEDLPWCKEINEKFCNNCETETVHYDEVDKDFEVLPCEYGDCPFGIDFGENTCKRWLEREAK